MGKKEWDKLIKKINNILKEKEAAGIELLNKGIKMEKGGIVITHGTDTLDLTSLVTPLELSSTFRDDTSFPIIFTASYATLDAIDTDAKSNFFKAVYVAKERFNRNYNLLPGVYVLIGQDIHLASRITKVYTAPNTEKKYFFSFPSPIGMITGKENRFKINYDFLNELTKKSDNNYEKFENAISDWGIVEYINLDFKSEPETIQMVKKRFSHYESNSNELRVNGAKSKYALVIQGDFVSNNKFRDICEYIHDLADDGYLVFFGSKRVYEKINFIFPSKNFGLIPKCLSHLKAKTKISWLMRFNLSNEEIIRYMNVNFAGELFSSSTLPEWINYETLQTKSKGKEIVLTYPDIDEKVFEDAIDRLNKSGSDDKELFVYGFGDGHIPTHNKSIRQIVNEYISNTLRITDIVISSEDMWEIVNELKNKINHETIRNHYLVGHLVNNEKMKK